MQLYSLLDFSEVDDVDQTRHGNQCQDNVVHAVEKWSDGDLHGFPAALADCRTYCLTQEVLFSCFFLGGSLNEAGLNTDNNEHQNENVGCNYHYDLHFSS